MPDDQMSGDEAALLPPESCAPRHAHLGSRHHSRLHTARHETAVPKHEAELEGRRLVYAGSHVVAARAPW